MAGPPDRKIHIAHYPPRKMGQNFYKSLCGRWKKLELFDRGEVMPTCQTCLNHDKAAVSRAMVENIRKKNAQDRRLRRKRIRRPKPRLGGSH